MKHNFFFSRRASLACAAVLAAAALASCKDTTTPGVATPSAVVAASSPPATAQVATTVTGPAVTVTDAGGSPIAGVQVNFAVTGGGGTLQYPVATTDAQGVASAGLWQIGPKVNTTNTATATVAPLSPVTFTVLANLPGPPANIAKSGGDGQKGAPGSTLPTPLSVRITDAAGNPKPGVVVTFAVTTTSTGGSLSSTTGTTDANGVTSSGDWTLGSGQCAPQTARATTSATDGNLSTVFSADSRGDITVGGTEAGTLGSGDCLIAGKLADEYDLTTPSGAINVSMTGVGFGPQLEVISTNASTKSASVGGTSPSFTLITAASDKAVRATSAAAGGTGAYTVSVASASSAVTDCSTPYIEVGASTDQDLSTSDCQTNYADVSGDGFLLYLTAGESVRISQTAVPLDALIAFFDPTGTQLFERDNGGVGATGTEVINYTATATGVYKIVASSYCLVYDDLYRAACDYGPYTLSVIHP